jgi:hypothetical protein
MRTRINLATFAAFLSGFGALTALACSGSGAGQSSVLPGGSCESDGEDCGSVGSVCASGAECASGACLSGLCSDPPVIGAGGTASGGTGGDGFILTEDYQPATGGTSVCVDLNVDFERVTPTVVLLIDRSGSMTEAFDQGRNRWQTLVDTLTDPRDSLIKQLEGSVRFGMALYTSNEGFGDGSRRCPILTNVDISLGNFASISGALSRTSNGPSGDTPTAESVEAVAAELAAFGEDGPKSIILATDGEPDTCEDPLANDDDGSRAKSVAAVAAAHVSGITTHIISVGDEISESHLKALAVAGAGGDEGAQAYTALDTAELEGAFEDIIGNVQTCDFALEGTVERRDAPRGKVLLDGEALTYGDGDGWMMPDPSTVRLRGQACETVQSNAAGISMTFPCDAIQIIPR